MASDPVCGMYVPETLDQLQVRRGDHTFYFCSTACQRTFEAPEQEQRVLLVYTVASFVAGAALLWLMLIGSPWDLRTTNLAALAIATPIQFVAGARFYAGFWHSIRARAANMDTLIALGTTTAYGYSAVVAVFPGRYGDDVFFETSVLIIGFILLGKSLEHAMQRRATDAVRALVGLQPRTAHIEDETGERDIPIEEVRVGQRLIVKPGERIPTDARIVSGNAEIDESLVTGESMPVAKGPGAEVVGASINTNGLLLVEATRIGSDTLVAQIAQLVEAAKTGRAPIQRLVDTVSAWFVPAVLLIACGSAIVWKLFLGAGLTKAVLVFVAVVIIACPCALGLATPAALLIGVGRGARFGVLVKEPEQLERAAKVTLVLFDKTGTLTLGRPDVTDLVPAPGVAPEDVIRLAASVESGSEHVLGQAVVREAGAKNVRIPRADAFSSSAGRGVTGRVQGEDVRVGTAGWLTEQGIRLAELQPDLERLQREAKTVLIVARGPVAIGLVAVRDPLKPGASEAVSRLRGLGIQAGLVSGDNLRTAEAVARQLGIVKIRAPVLPADKAAIVSEFQRQGHVVAMVGDGVNDAPALAAADVGIALGSGTDVAREAGGLVLLKNDPRDVPNAIELGRRTMGKIRQNLFWAFAYNVALIPVAATGVLDPVFAGAAMGLSSVTVVGNSLLLQRFRPGLRSEGGVKGRAAAPTQTEEKPKARRALPVIKMESTAEGSERDPVCGMSVDPATAKFHHEHAGKTYYFCSAGCQRRFEAAPATFLR